jgi:hypothetical protein
MNVPTTYITSLMSSPVFRSKLSFVPKELIRRALKPTLHNLHPTLPPHLLRPSTTTTTTTNLNPSPANTNLFNIDTLRHYLRTRRWPIFPTPGGNQLPKHVPIWEALVSSVLTYPLTLLAHLTSDHITSTLATTQAPPRIHTVNSTKILLLGPRREATLPSVFWIETWYGIYFHVYNASLQQNFLNHTKGVRRSHIEITKRNKANSTDFNQPTTILPSFNLHSPDPSSSPTNPRHAINDVSAHLPTRTLFVDLAIDFIGPEVPMDWSESIDLFGNAKIKKVESSLTLKDTTPHHSHIGTLALNRVRGFLDTTDRSSDPHKNSALSKYSLIYLSNPGVGHVNLREGWASTLEYISDYYSKTTSRCGETVLISSYNCAVDGKRDLRMLKSYFLPHKFMVIDTGINEFGDRVTTEDHTADPQDGNSARNVASNFGVIRVVKKRNEDQPR